MKKNNNNIVFIGEKVELFRIVDAFGEPVDPPKRFNSKVVDEMKDGMLYLAMPLEGGRVIPLSIGETYLVWFYTGAEIYQCKAEVADRKREGNIFILVCKVLTQIEKNQRREYYRMGCVMELKYRLIEPKEELLTNRLKNNRYDSEEERKQDEAELEEIQSLFATGTVIDISGGGVRFNADSQLKKDENILMKIQLPIAEEDVQLELKGVVVSSEEIFNRRGMYDNRIQFLKIGEMQRETIIKYIFQQERIKLRREKGTV